MSYGLYVEDRELCGLADQLRAWSLVLPPPAAFTHLTAAELRGWWLPQRIPHPVFAALREGDPCPHRSGLLVSRHPSRVPSELVSGIRLTTPAETLLAAARDLGVLDLVLMGDSALRLGHCTIFDQWGRFVARGDLWIVGTSRLHEFDGGVHREPDAQSRDLARDRRLIEAGCRRFGFTKAQLLNEGATIIASTDTLLGRSWDPARLRRWNALVAEPLFGRLGRARALRHWQAAR
jgi:hypothetical protein